MSTYRELVAAAIPSREAADLTGVSRASANYTPRAGVQLARVVPVNKLSAAERAHVLAVMDSDRFVDLAPLQIYGQLLDEGTYLCSVSTFYRVLAEHKQVKERRRLARHPARVRPELVAAGPGQVFSWDITKLAGPVKGRYYDAYVMIDFFSRYIVGVSVQAHESGPLAVEMMKEVFGIHGIPQIVHADRGTSMTSKTVASLLADLQVTRSHSRPRVSNDNPYSEAWFKTLKYAPVFPDRFGSLATPERSWTASSTTTTIITFTGIGLHTPADVHYGASPQSSAAKRAETLASARASTPADSPPQPHPRSSPAGRSMDQPTRTGGRRSTEVSCITNSRWSQPP